MFYLPSAANNHPPSYSPSLKLWELAVPQTIRVQISASRGKVLQGVQPVLQEFKRQQALYKEHAHKISQAQLFGKHWYFREKQRLLVVDGVVVGSV
jgi:hypothetical protein